MQLIEAIILVLVTAILMGTTAGLVDKHFEAQRAKAKAATFEAIQEGKRHAIMCKQYPELKVCRN